MSDEKICHRCKRSDHPFAVDRRTGKECGICVDCQAKMKAYRDTVVKKRLAERKALEENAPSDNIPWPATIL